MVERVVYFGPFNNSKKQELINNSIEYLKSNKGNNFYYILPNGELLKHYRRKFIEAAENTFELNVFTFDDIVENLMDDVSLEKISNPLKNAIIRDCLIKLNLSQKLEYYKNSIDMGGFIKTCNSIIGEIKRSLISPIEYMNTCGNNPELMEMGMIYSEYEKVLEKFNITDRESNYINSIKAIKEDSSFVQHLDFIVIDEFYDFRPIEIAILKELSKLDINIYINMPVKTGSKNPIIEKTIEELLDLGFVVENINNWKYNLFEDLANTLFTVEKNKYNKSQNLKVLKADSMYLECKKIFEEIKLHFIKGIKLNNMGIVVTSNNYLETIFKVAKEEKVSLNRSNTTNLMDKGLTKELLTILENVINNGDKSTLINRIKSKYFPLVEKNEIESLEFVLRKLNFLDLTGLKKLVESSKEFNFSSETLASLNNFIQKVEKEITSFSQYLTIDEYRNSILNLLEDFQVDNIPIEEYKIMDDYEHLSRDLNIISEVRNIVNLSGELSITNDHITLEDYYNSLIDYLEDIEIREDIGSRNGVKIFEPINIRGFKNEILFIVGLSQGSYPNLKRDNFFLKETNRLQFNRMNLDYSSYEERYNNEAIKFKSIISTCLKQLYLSYASNMGDDDSGIPSMFLDEIYSLFQGETLQDKIETININLDYIIKKDINKITNNRDLSNFLLYNHFNGVEIHEDYYHLHNSIFKDKLLNINSKLLSEVSRLTDKFDIYRGRLNNEHIIQEIKKQMEKRAYSISYLESYSKCPFYFLLNNYFKVEKLERDIEEYSPMDIGSIYHETLRWFYLNYKEEIKNKVIHGDEFPNKVWILRLREKTKETFQEYGFDLKHNRNRAILENLADKLINFISSDLIRISNPKERLIPYEFELEFGKEELFKIEINGLEIPITGIIDRVDKFIDRSGYLVMDYKSSSYGTRDIDHMKSGLSLQLPVYIMSYPEKVIGSMYGIVGSGKFEIPLGILEESTIISKRHKGGVNQEQWDELLEITKENIQKNIIGIKSGDFSVKPLECSPYCQYKDICRYEKIWEVEEE